MSSRIQHERFAVIVFADDKDIDEILGTRLGESPDIVHELSRSHTNTKDVDRQYRIGRNKDDVKKFCGASILPRMSCKFPYLHVGGALATSVEDIFTPTAGEVQRPCRERHGPCATKDHNKGRTFLAQTCVLCYTPRIVHADGALLNHGVPPSHRT